MTQQDRITHIKANAFEHISRLLQTSKNVDEYSDIVDILTTVAEMAEKEIQDIIELDIVSSQK